jgi:hypothetical protein
MRDPFVHRPVRPRLQNQQSPQEVVKGQTTRWPTCRLGVDEGSEEEESEGGPTEWM